MTVTALPRAVVTLPTLMTIHFPREYHADLRALVTEWVCFNMSAEPEPEAAR